MKRQPDHTQLLKVLNKQAPDRPTLFEFFLNDRLYTALNNGEAPVKGDKYDWARVTMYAYKNAGYDYTTQQGCGFGFPQHHRERLSTCSLNEGSMIYDWASYEKYDWPNPEDFDYSLLKDLELPEGMRIVMWGPGGVLENVIGLVGYDNLCTMLFEEPALAKQIFDDVGSRLLRYYEIGAEYDNVCAIISNDDWGFKTQTMLSPADMRRYVFPWHKRIVAAAHTKKKPAILHSCGAAHEIMEDIIEDMGFDGKHSFEDAIMPIEEIYELYKGRIALLGGIDVHFVCTEAPEAIAARSRAMLERASVVGGYALGTGNSVPGYVPDEGYYAMIDVVRK